MTNVGVISRHYRSISTVLILILSIGSVGVATFWLPPPKAEADSSRNIDVLVIHGLNGYVVPGTDTSTWGYDCKHGSVDPGGNNINAANGANGEPADAYNFIQNVDHVNQGGVSSFHPVMIGYYQGDQNCDGYLISEHNRCTSEPAGAEGSYNEDLRHLGCELAWYIYDNYTSQGREVRVLAHSMGGLLIRWALYKQGQPNYPPSLNVPAVVTMSTPHGGVQEAGILCNNCIQAGQMQANNTTFLEPMIQHALNPQGTTGTIWTTIGSEMDADVNVYSALQMVGPKFVYGFNQNGSITPWSPAYSHGGSIADESMANDAWVKSCVGSCAPPGPSAYDTYPATFTGLHALATAEMAFLNPLPSSAGATPAGWPSSIGGSMIAGWACDNTNGASISQIDFYADAPYGQAGTHYLGGVIANSSRSDLVAAGVCGRTPNHGFQFDASAAGTGQHKIWAYNKVSGTVTPMGNSGNLTVSIGQPYPDGWFVTSSGGIVTGWACDETTVTNTSQIDFYADAPYGQAGTHYLGSTMANIPRSDLVANGVCGSTPNHGFQFDASGAGSGQHTIWAYNKVSGTVTTLGNSGNVIVRNAPPQPAGWMVSDGNITISGWACDNAFGGATSQVDFYANAPYGQSGSLYLGGAIANIGRSDLVAAGVCQSTPNHGFQFIAHAGAGLHTIWAYNKVSNTVTLLGNSGNVSVETGGCPPIRCN